jgi:hypothetical protein
MEIVTRSTRQQKARTSKYLGVSWHASKKAWWAKISVLGVRKDLGLFAEEISAARAYNVVAATCGRPLNFIEG